MLAVGAAISSTPVVLPTATPTELNSVRPTGMARVR
jgi:hypothetical protein